MKAERRGKSKTEFCNLTMPKRLLSYEKIVKAERNGKTKACFWQDIAEQRPIFVKQTFLCHTAAMRYPVARISA